MVTEWLWECLSEFFDETIEDKVVPFEKENVMVLFTDGVTEAENGDREDSVKTGLSEKLSAGYAEAK